MNDADAPLVWLDLCSGLGGASQPALDRGWRVIRIDIDFRFHPTIVADVRALPLRPFHVDVLWASPPCQEFSKHGLRCFYPNPAPPDLTIANAVWEFIATLRPATWFVENVWSARPFLTGIFGPVRALIPGHAIWSSTLVLFPQVRPHKTAFCGPDSRYRGRHRRPHVGGNRALVAHDAMVAAVAAKIPYEIGATICHAVEQRRRNERR